MYVDYFGLKEAPFQLTPDPDYWFESAAQARAQAYLNYGLTQGEGFVVITGDAGLGKTTLVHHLLQELDPARYLPVFLVTSQVDDGDLLRLVAQGLGLATEGAEKAQLLARIERMLGECARAGRRVLLIVDEAQALSPTALEALRMLSNFQIGGTPLIQILLVGQSEFRQRLVPGGPLEQLRQRVIAQHHMEPLGPEEVRTYLQHRLTRAGWQGRPAFTDGACALLHHASKGVARSLNALAARALLSAAVEEQSEVDDRMVAALVAEMESEYAGPAELASAPEARALGENGASADVRAAFAELRQRVDELDGHVEDQQQVLDRLVSALVEWVDRAERAQSEREASEPAPIAMDRRHTDDRGPNPTTDRAPPSYTTPQGSSVPGFSPAPPRVLASDPMGQSR